MRGKTWALIFIHFPHLNFQWCSISVYSPPWWSAREDCQCRTLSHSLSPRCSGFQVESSLLRYWLPADGRVRNLELQEHEILLKKNDALKGLLLNSGNSMKSWELGRSNAALTQTLQRSELYCTRESKEL